MYRSRPWTRRNIICFRTVEATNERMRRFLDRGQTGVSYGGDNPTFRGFDTNEVDREPVGRTGAMIDSLADHRIAMDGIPIDEVSCALRDVSPHELVAMHVALADERGVPREKLAGTTMHSDYVNKLVGGRMFTRFPQAAHRRPFRDHIEYVLEHLPKWNPVSLTGQNIQQAGATPAQEAAFTIAASIDYLEEAVDLGIRPGRLCRAVHLLQRLDEPLRGGGEVPGCSPGLGTGTDRTVRRGPRTPSSGVTVRPTGRNSPAHGRKTASRGWRSRRSRQCSAGPSRYTPTRTTSRSGRPARRPRGSPWTPSTSSWRRRTPPT
jgi:hypothetical protein